MLGHAKSVQAELQQENIGEDYMEEASYYRERAIRAVRLAFESQWREIRQALEFLSQQSREIAEDIEHGQAP